MLAFAVLVLPAPFVHADSYGGPDYSKSQGSVTASGSADAPYASYNGGWGAQNGTTGVGGTAQSSGGSKMSAAFKWSGPSQPPQSVIVTETSSVAAIGISYYPQNQTPSASCFDGLGNTGTVTTTYNPPPPMPPVQEIKQTSLTTTRYTMKSGSALLTLTASPTAVGSGSPGLANASVSYSASVSPVTIQLTGPSMDSNGNYDILVGQQCSASVSGIPSPLLNGAIYNWTVGGDNFQSWTASTPPVLKPTVLNQSSAAWYWKDQSKTSETVTCQVTLTPPAGQGSAFTVTVTQMVTVYVPNWKSGTSTSAGTMKVDANCPGQSGVCLYAGPSAGQAGGINWSLKVITPQTPMAFGSGTIELIQLIDTQRSFCFNTGTTQPVQGAQYVSIDNGKTGLDTHCPYALATGSGTTATLGQSDSPDISLDSSIYSASLEDTFTDYLMYKPPGAGSVSWVPLASMTWHPDGNAIIPASGMTPGDWTKYKGSPGMLMGGSFSATSTFPSWTASYSGNDQYMPS